MKVLNAEFEGVRIIEPDIFRDSRGYFCETYLPKGFAHGFVVLEGNTLFSYKCDDFYCKESERGLMFNDPALKIEWPPLDMPILLSEKDQKHPALANIEPWEAM